MKNSISIAELERRMRPGGYSRAGFLGPEECLEEIIRRDEQALRAVGVSCDRIAAELERILTTVLEQRHELLYSHSTEWLVREDPPFEWYDQPGPLFSPYHLPDVKYGYLAGNRFQVFFKQYRGLQECPWDCAIANTWSSFDFMLLNRDSVETILMPGLIVHLIGVHHFFEGLESVYRVDPMLLARVLGLIG